MKLQNSNNMENKNDVKNENIRKDEIIVEKVLINRISTDLLVQCILYTSLCSFMLGYHVHEKAILIPIICSALLTSKSNENAILFLRLSAIGIFSLFPLFTKIDELLIKCEQISCFVLLFCICNFNFDCFLSPSCCYIKNNRIPAFYYHFNHYYCCFYYNFYYYCHYHFDSLYFIFSIIITYLFFIILFSLFKFFLSIQYLIIYYFISFQFNT